MFGVFIGTSLFWIFDAFLWLICQCSLLILILYYNQFSFIFNRVKYVIKNKRSPEFDLFDRLTLLYVVKKM